jgi:hypothetical protein
MSTPRRSVFRSRRPAWLLPAVLAALCLLAPGVRTAAAAPIKPWMPPSADTLLTWATEARVRFQTNTGDSVGGRNYEAYEMVARMGERVLQSMGRSRMVQAPLIETVFDSLGLDTDISFDPDLPYFALLMVRNPFNRAAASVGYLYWYKQEALRVQGVLFYGGREPKSKVWWTGDTSGPYSWGVLDQSLTDPPTVGLTFLRLEPGGNFWDLVQFAADTLNLGGPGTAEWVDVNRDGVPEVVTWIKGEVDSTFTACNGCPELIAERTFVERKQGFQLEESRLMPTSFASLVLFVRMLQDGNRAGAARLVADPKMVEQAIGYGWNRKGKGLWRFENAEPGERWPRWMAFSNPGQGGKKTTYVIHFGHADGRWILAKFEPTRRPPAQGGAGQ